MPKVCVIGSLNVDYFTKVARLPQPGETVPASDFEIRFGGKGANQAVAAARQGVSVTLAGCVGEDEMGAAYLERLRKEGINLEIKRTDLPTGSAFISVDAKGENTIVVAAGANGKMDRAAVGNQREHIEKADALLLQFETPMNGITEAVEAANARGIPVILNPSPFCADFPWSRLQIDYLIVNEREAEQIDAALHGNDELLARRLIITRGSESTLIYSEEGELEIPTLEVSPIDTVGAGDAFAGTFAARLVLGESLADAVRHANVAGALTTLRLGAQEGMPVKKEVDGR